MSALPVRTSSGKSWISKRIRQLQEVAKEQHLGRSANVAIRRGPTGTSITAIGGGKGGGGEGAVWL
jgi:hypothetical protein